MHNNPHAFGSAYYSGMTLRDYFAGQAIAGVVMQCAADTINPSGTPCDERITRAEYFARMAGEIADAMIAEGTKYRSNRINL